MEKIKVQNRELELFYDIKELPITRYHAFQRMCLLDAGLGSDLSAVDNHLGRIKAFLISDEKEKALTEIENLRTNFWFMQSGISPALMSFAVLVYKLDGKIKGDLTDDGIKKTCEDISFLTAGQVEQTTSEIKKKSRPIWQDIFRRFSIRRTKK